MPYKLYSYPYKYLGIEKSECIEVEKVGIYRFKSLKTNQTYIAKVEYYPYKVRVIKFFLKNHRDSPLKYNLLTNLREVRPVVCTCASILLDLLRADDELSFGFIGAETITRDKIETKDNTARFKTYASVVSNYISTENFEHREQGETSGYILVNKRNKNKNPDLINNIEDLFQRLYLDLNFN